jgi:hypothetical protein
VKEWYFRVVGVEGDDDVVSTEAETLEQARAALEEFYRGVKLEPMLAEEGQAFDDEFFGNQRARRLP